ncbi:beta-ketoacyl synthase chain length factor [Autumnicola musiva]|uniref:Beta-ketoacyl synthase chain length factor n=1 Tax=Autumnicola musiva TaxID=3075589 RepID=A0ABU3D724_9FLAO|nr:beta-ketoacyl synthase chain length factor [Zunongwangia sp. F117]MDT0677336.1 beta-ketoacyl synthase chain length factor [Zunongwangia sp. F117]
MENNIYINGICSISAQPENAPFSEAPLEYHDSIITALAPNYKEYIPPIMLRRMSKAVKMGLVAAKRALKEANVEIPDAIITGTGEGCKQDTEKFLQNMLDQDEELLSPTAFIQSTHNTVGGQIALNLKCTGYNVTYTQNSASLESAFLDALLYFAETNQEKHILVGGVEEIAKKSTPFYYLDGQLKNENISNLALLASDSPGTITSEGAHFFALSNKLLEKSYAVLRDLKIIHSVSEECLTSEVSDFLKSNLLNPSDIDMLIFGNNGDSRFDGFYQNLQLGLFKETIQLGYKHLTGDYNTVSGYAVSLAAKILKGGQIPEILKLNAVKATLPKHILIYNQYLGSNHSFILVSKI